LLALISLEAQNRTILSMPSSSTALGMCVRKGSAWDAVSGAQERGRVGVDSIQPDCVSDIKKLWSQNDELNLKPKIFNDDQIEHLFCSVDFTHLSGTEASKRGKTETTTEEHLKLIETEK
jgi:hypothetical protein